MDVVVLVYVDDTIHDHDHDYSTIDYFDYFDY